MAGDTAGRGPLSSFSCSRKPFTDQSEELTVYPPRSLGEAFRRYRRTDESTRKRHAPVRTGGEPGNASSPYLRTRTHAPSTSKI